MTGSTANAWTVVAVAAVLAACQASAALGGSCSRASDCAAPLACAFGRCRPECRQSRDCPPGSRCIVSGSGAACTLDSENHCDTSVCPAPLVCMSDQCRTRCTSTTSCVAATASCEMQTCVEPVSPTADAGTPDAASTDADGGAPTCAFSVAMPARIATSAQGHHVAIATSETSPTGTPVGFLHVGAIAQGAARPTALVTTVPAANVAATPMLSDLSSEAFFLVGPQSIALGRNGGGDVAVFAAFDGTSDTMPGSIVGAIGTIAAGTGTTVWGSWLCSESMAGGCANPPTMVSAVRGRLLASETPFRLAFRYRVGAGAMQLAGSDESFATGVSVPAPAYATSDFVEMAGHGGSWIALADTSGGTIALWDTIHGGALTTLTRQPPATRAALAYLGGPNYVLAFGDASGAIDIYGATCSTSCAVTPMAMQELRLVPTAGSSYVLPVAVPDPAGSAVFAYVERRAGSPDVVRLVVLSNALALGFAGAPVYTATSASRQIVDVQLASVRDGGDYVAGIAVLEGPLGGADGDTVWLTSARAPAACF